MSVVNFPVCLLKTAAGMGGAEAQQQPAHG